MTNLDRLKSLLGFAPPDNSAEGALLDAGINPVTVYDPLSSIDIKKVAIQVMEVILTTADITNGQVGFSTKYDRNAILARIKMIKEELGIVDETVPTIRGIHVW